MKHEFKQLAKKLDEAAKESKAIEQISNIRSITLDEAYSIQKESFERRYERDEKLTGLKLGFTSKAKMKQMGVHDLIWGRLTDTMEIRNGGVMHLNNFIQPRAEPEIAFLLKSNIDGEVTLENVQDYIEGIAPAIEIIDSRYKNFIFSLEDIVADNCFSAGYIIGEWSASNLDISNLDLSFSINGEQVQTGNSNAILGNPLQSLVEAVRLAQQNNQALKKGMIILAGAVTPSEFVKSGDVVEAIFEKLGKATLKVL